VAGQFTGTIDIQCNDPLIPVFSFPLTLTATPLGPHAVFEFDPSPLNFVGRVGQTQTLQLAIRNTGTASGYLSDVAIESEAEPGTFMVPVTIPDRTIGVGQTKSLPVSCHPKSQGKTSASLKITSYTNVWQGFDSSRVSLNSVATTPRIVVRRDRPSDEPIGGTIMLGNLGMGGVSLGGGLDGGSRGIQAGFIPILSGPVEIDLGYAIPDTVTSSSFFIDDFEDFPVQ
jgi:hypothetical protein